MSRQRQAFERIRAQLASIPAFSVSRPAQLVIVATLQEMKQEAAEMAKLDAFLSSIPDEIPDTFDTLRFRMDYAPMGVTQ